MTHYPRARVTCPVCGAEVTVEIEPGEEEVRWPNERAHPGAPPEVIDVRGCACWDSMNFFRRKTTRGYVSGVDWYEETLLERAGRTNPAGS